MKVTCVDVQVEQTTRLLADVRKKIKVSSQVLVSMFGGRNKCSHSNKCGKMFSLIYDPKTCF